MAITLTYPTAVAAVEAIATLVDGGVPASSLVIYGGTPPANASAALSSNPVLVDFALPDPAFGAAADLNPGAIVTAEAITPVTASATGTATFFRILDGDDNVILQGSVTDTGGNGDLKLSSTAIISGIDVTVVSLTITMPEA
jgi:hypothetical protein